MILEIPTSADPAKVLACPLLLLSELVGLVVFYGIKKIIVISVNTSIAPSLIAPAAPEEELFTTTFLALAMFTSFELE